MTNYVVGHNMPGYLPESDPYVFADWESARNDLIWELDSIADYFDQGDQDDERTAAGSTAADRALAEAKALKPGETFLAYVDIECYWLSETDEEPSDPDA